MGIKCPLELTFETAQPNTALHIHRYKRGNPIHVEIRSFPLKDASGTVTAVIEVINDITEKKKLEDQLRHAQKMEAVGTLAGGIAHDFNNILNVILGYGGMVLDGLGADNPLRTNMNEVLAAAEKAANLTKRLLVFSRKQVVDVKPVNINETILGIQKMLARIIMENIDFKLDLADRQLIVMADAGQIEQVLMNLATNARDAMPKGGRLTIGTGIEEINDEYIAANGYGKPGIYATVTVSDTGPGIDDRYRRRYGARTGNLLRNNKTA